MTIWFTADQHWAHHNIIEYTNRPFDSVEQMDAEQIRRWNEKVKPGDTVYHLGDVCFGSGSLVGRYFSKLNGQIKVLGYPWHHDKRWLASVSRGRKIYSKSGQAVTILPPMVVLEFPRFSKTRFPKAIVLCHYQIARWPRKHYNSWHLFGHSHGKVKDEGLSMDVGVDCWDFAPIPLYKVAEIMMKKESETAEQSFPYPAHDKQT